MSKENPMCVKYNSSKVEFALCGAGHIHVILWVDWAAFEVLHPEKAPMIVNLFKKYKMMKHSVQMIRNS